MNTDEKIVKYIENELTPDQRIEFEAEIKKTPKLRNELKNYLLVSDETLKLKEVKLNSDYLNSILPEFRNKLQSRKLKSIKLSLGYAVGIMIAFIISIAILNNFLSDNVKSSDLPEFTNSLNENQKMELLENLNDDLYLSEINADNISVDEINLLITAELELNSDIAEIYNINYDELIVGLGQNEINEIYHEILNRKF